MLLASAQMIGGFGIWIRSRRLGWIASVGGILILTEYMFVTSYNRHFDSLIYLACFGLPFVFHLWLRPRLFDRGSCQPGPKAEH
jgi:hypothetical protein